MLQISIYLIFLHTLMFQGTFWGRYRRCLDIIDPRTLLVSKVGTYTHVLSIFASLLAMMIRLFFHVTIINVPFY